MILRKHLRTVVAVVGLALSLQVVSCEGQDEGARASVLRRHESDRSCDFPRVDAQDLTPEAFHADFVAKGRPALVANAMEAWPSRSHLSWANLSHFFEGVQMRVGPGPYPSQRMGIDDYLATAEAAFAKGAGAEVPGVFQYGQVPTSWTLWAHKDACLPFVSFYHPNSEPLHDNFTVACELLSKVQVPEFLVGDASVDIPPNLITHSGFLVGYTGSGIDFHAHQAAINLVWEGRKLWYMKLTKAVAASYADVATAVPFERRHCQRHPEDEVCASNALQLETLRSERERQGHFAPPDMGGDAKAREDFHVGAFARQLATSQVTEELLEDSEVLHCVQGPGEIVFIPQDMQHAVMNLERTVGMQMQWNSELHKDLAERYKMYRYFLHDLDPREPDPDFQKVPFDTSLFPIGDDEGGAPAGNEGDDYDRHDLL